VNEQLLTTEQRRQENLRAAKWGREQGENDLFWWCKNVMGFRDMDEQPHRQMCRFLEDWGDWKWIDRGTDSRRMSESQQRIKLMLAPRRSLKSSLVVGWSLQQYVKYPTIRTLIDSATLDKSIDKIGRIKSQVVGDGFDGDAMFRSFYGNRMETSPDFQRWREDQIRLKGLQDDASFTASSPGHEKTSFHYELIIIDDPHDENNSETADQIEKVIRHIKLLLSVLEPNGRMLIDATRWATHDALQWAIEKLDLLDVMEESADPEDRVGKPAFWPRVFTSEFLEKQRKRQGVYIYSCMYRNKPVPREKQKFLPEWIKYYDAYPVCPLNKYLLVDPVPIPKEERRKGDHAAFVVTGIAPDGKVYVLEAIRRRPRSLTEVAELILFLLDKHNPLAVGIETVAGQTTYRAAVDHICRTEHKRQVPWQWLKTSSLKGKEQRILGLVPYVENGNLLIRPQMTDVEEELLRFPDSRHHDDLIDALAYGPQLWRTPRAASRDAEVLALLDPRIKHDYMSYGWMIKESQKKQNKPDRYDNKRTVWKSVWDKCR